ncbi:FkbM family methyltransferase [Phragmitibacter flavus]|uniref:FkbM family methyltransferase n=1 Tax=Phragmitibacter flavus TaxID=2576071 RepID=A0A5R8K8P9_9BACT|nr:FkbM family methyltransferase [Phragmitibacter flavus]TLD68671.1 FkbM family methyltransferase [Phragmitibacter flavus]
MPKFYAKEVGYLRYLTRAFSWRLQTKIFRNDLSFVLPTGVEFGLPSASPLARDIYISQCNVDGNAAYILASYLQQQSEHGEPGDFIDIGANIGYYTALISPLVRRSYAFEPDQGHHVFLSPVLIATGNARLVPQAASNFTGPGALHIAGHADHSHLVENIDVPGAVEVEVTTLDDFCRTHPDVHPALIKIDAEGHDIAVLEGALRIAKQFKPVFCVEFNLTPDRPNSIERLQKFLETTKYDLFAIAQQNLPSPNDLYALKKLTPSEIAAAQPKMLILAPPSEPFFKQLAAKLPAELRRCMRPAQIHQFLGSPPLY